MHTHIHVHLHTHIHVHIHTHIHVRIYTYIHVHLHTHIYMCTYTHVHIQYIHTHRYCANLKNKISFTPMVHKQTFLVAEIFNFSCKFLMEPLFTFDKKKTHTHTSDNKKKNL